MNIKVAAFTVSEKSSNINQLADSISAIVAKTGLLGFVI